MTDSDVELAPAGRTRHLARFYELISELRDRLGGFPLLAACHGRMTWPRRGVYFFFEPGEVRSSGTEQRVIRVGTHALSATSKTTLWDRLSQHRGRSNGDGGNHRGSVFRLLAGEALLRRSGASIPTWGVGSSAGAAARLKTLCDGRAVRELERPLERDVSQYLGAMRVGWVRAEDEDGIDGIRGLVERNAIALLSNRVTEPLDPPSPRWLGLHSAHEHVRTSGLWNNNHVDERYDPAFLDLLEYAVRQTNRDRRAFTS